MKKTIATTETKPDLPTRKRSTPFVVVITFLTIGLLSGCGGGWQADHDVHQDQIRPGVDGSGLTGPDDSRTRL